MAPTFVGSSAVGTQSNTTINLTWPGSLQAGDDGFVQFSMGNTALPTAAPSGFTLIADHNTGSNPRCFLYHKDLTGSESGSLACTVDNSSKISACLWIVRGLDATTPVNAISEFIQSVGGTTHDAPSVTATEDNCVIMVVATQRGTLTNSTWTPPTSFDSHEVDTLAQAGGSGGTCTAIASEPLTTTRGAGAVDPGNWTSGDSVSNVVLYTVALAPEAAEAPNLVFLRPVQAGRPRL